MLEFLEGTAADALKAANDPAAQPAMRWLNLTRDDLWPAANDAEYDNPEFTPDS